MLVHSAENPDIFRFSRSVIVVKSAQSSPSSMSAKSPKPRFEHRPMRGMPSRIESYCLRCLEFVAASDKPKLLRIAENAHVCASAAE